VNGDAVPAQYRKPTSAVRIELIASSFARLLQRPLVEPVGDVVAALWSAPSAVVAHGVEDDPLFFFGNRAALAAFECDVEGFVGMPSRHSAEPELRDERQRLLDRVSSDGFIDDYRGIRISATGRRFRIEQAIVWNLVDENGLRHGQAACFTL
jgi:hypothetical protein